jgi:hypothetical protein
MRQLIKKIGITSAIVVVAIVGTVNAQQPTPVLWISDDTSKTVYEVTVDDGPGGPKLMHEIKFGHVLTASSGIAVDPYDDTLWGASERKFLNPVLPRGAVVNFSKDGVLLGYIPAEDIGAFSIEGVAADYFDDTLWVVDDPTTEDLMIPGVRATVYHIAKDGTLLGSFPTTDFSDAFGSPQAIAADPFDGTLWVTDNRWNKVYNIERDGQLIASFEASAYARGGLPNNPQGISVDESDGTLWVTDRTSQTHLTSQKIYHITVTGDLITVFNSKDYDVDSTNPTGIAVDARAVMTRVHAVISDLQRMVDAIPPGVLGDDALDRDMIVDSIAHIEKSLKPRQWLDRTTPNPNKNAGGKVFKEHEHAVERLLAVRNTNGLTGVSGAIGALVDIDIGLAFAANAKAFAESILVCSSDSFGKACQKTTKKLAESDNKLVEAQTALDNGDPKTAIGKYKDAWKKARDAIKDANPGNTKPVAFADTLTTGIGQPLWLHLTGFDSDGGALFFVLDKLPTHGTLMLNSVTGVGLYTPDPGFSGNDKLSFRANDGIADSRKRNVELKVGLGSGPSQRSRSQIFD